jgi:transposase-like protein
MATWTEELKQEVIAKYEGAGPTPESSTEIIKDIAEEIEMSPNGVRMVLVQAGVYVKKEAGASTTKTKAPSGDGTKRVSKESSIAELRAAIETAGKEVDEDILSKLTGKAAVYFLSVLK